jgi:hypothetical protein
MFWVAVVGRIIHANLPLRTPDTGNATACLRFRFSAFALILHRNPRRCRSTRIPVGFPITPANRQKFPCANDGLGLAHALRIRHFASAAITEVAILLCVGACCACDATTSGWQAVINRLASIGKFYVEEGPQLGTDITQSVHKMGEVMRCRGETSFCTGNQAAFYRYRPADPGTVDGKRVYGIGRDRLANQLPDRPQCSAIQRYTGTAESDIHGMVPRVNMAYTVLGHDSPGVKQHCCDPDKNIYFIHFLSYFTMHDHALELLR